MTDKLEPRQDGLAGSMLGLFTGDSTLLVGVEDNPGGGLRCFLGHRSNGLYAVVDDPEDMERVRRAWYGSIGHVCFPTPPADRIYSEKDDDCAAA